MKLMIGNVSESAFFLIYFIQMWHFLRKTFHELDLNCCFYGLLYHISIRIPMNMIYFVKKIDQKCIERLFTRRVSFDNFISLVSHKSNRGLYQLKNVVRYLGEWIRFCGTNVRQIVLGHRTGRKKSLIF